MCTHGKHDQCCAVRGRAVARHIAARYPVETWECSHVGGDRFAANLIVLPSGTYYGGLDPDAVDAVLDAHRVRQIPAAHLRGVTTVSPVGQAGLIGALRELGPGPLPIMRARVLPGGGPDRWQVEVAGHPRAKRVVVEVSRVVLPPARRTCQGGAGGVRGELCDAGGRSARGGGGMSADLGRLLKRTYAAVLFDMDGTLIDSAPSVLRSWTNVVGGVRHRPGAAEDLPRRAGERGDRPLPRAPEVHERADARLRELEIADAVGIPILPGGAEALAALAGSGRVAIATSCTADLAEARVAASGLAAPPVLVTASECTRGKPDPEPYLRAAERLGVDPRECLVVEDATAGLAAARAAGCATLALTTTTRADVIAAAGDADAIVPDLSAVRFVVTSEGVRIEGSG